jgi:hypothetical protein
VTTPERLRRRQHFIEVLVGVTLVFVGLGMVWQADHYKDLRQEQAQCFSDQFHELSVVLSKRGELNGAENKANADFLLGLAALSEQYSGDENNPPTPEQQQKGRLALRELLRAYSAEQIRIREERKTHKIPEYPTDQCT